MYLTFRVVIVLMIGGGVFFAVSAQGDHVDAIGPALLVMATIMPFVNPSKAINWTQDCRRRSFERRIDASKDHVKTIVKETVHDVLPDRMFDHS